MIPTLCLLSAVGFFANAVLHLLLLFGQPLGEYVLGGKHVVLPYKMRIISVFFLLFWIFAGICYLNYGKLLQLTALKQLDKGMVLFSTFFLFFATFSNAFLTKSKKERRVMTPFCSIMFGLSLGLLLL